MSACGSRGSIARGTMTRFTLGGHDDPQLDTSLDTSPRIPALTADLSADAAHAWLAGAGLALDREAPVYTSAVGTCRTGVVRRRGRSVTSGAAVMVPVADADGRIRAVVGVGYAEPREIDDGLLDGLRAGARSLLARI